MDLVDALIRDAQKMAGEGRGADAVEALDRALEAAPDNGLAWFTRGIVLAELGEHERAVVSYVEAAKLEPHKASLAFFNAGKSLVAMGELVRALECFADAAELEPGDMPCVLEQARVLVSLGRHAKALERYDRAIVLAPNEARLWTERGDCLRALKRFDDAVSSYGRGLAKRGADRAAHAGMARALVELGRGSDALKTLTEGLAAEPDWVDGWIQKAGVLAQLQRVPEAVRSLDEAAQLEPGSARIEAERGELLHAAGALTDALLAYGRALSLDDSQHTALLGTTEVLFEFARWGECALMAVRCLEASHLSEAEHKRARAIFDECTRHGGFA